MATLIPCLFKNACYAVQATDVQGGTSPSAVYFNNRSFVFFTRSDGGVSYTQGVELNDLAWEAPVNADGLNVQAGTSPAAVIFRGVLYVFYSGSGGDGIWCTSSSDGSKWSPVASLVRSGASWMHVMPGSSPAAVVSGDSLFVFFVGSGSDGIWYTSTADGKAWEQVQQLTAGGTDVKVGSSPAAIIYGTTMYLFGIDHWGRPFFSSSADNGNTWTKALSVGCSATGGVSPMVRDGNLFLFLNSYFNNAQQLGYTWYAVGSSWAPIQSVGEMTDGGNATTPAALEIDGLVYLFWNKGDDIAWVMEQEFFTNDPSISSYVINYNITITLSDEDFRTLEEEPSNPNSPPTLQIPTNSSNMTNSTGSPPVEESWSDGFLITFIIAAATMCFALVYYTSYSRPSRNDIGAQIGQARRGRARRVHSAPF